VGTGPHTLYFSGHYDVVPAQSRDQFQPRVEGRNLFGRGSSDMKSGLAAFHSESNQFSPSQTASDEQRQNRPITLASETV